MRHSVFTSLAYGAKGIQWFHGKHLFAGDHLRPNGRDVAVINAELQELGPALVSLRSVDVYHTPPSPPATRQIPKTFWTEIAGGEFVLGLMKHPGQPDTDYFLLAHRDHTRGEEAALKFTRLGITVEKMNKNTGDWESQTVTEVDGLSRVTLPVGAGDGELLRALSWSRFPQSAIGNPMGAGVASGSPKCRGTLGNGQNGEQAASSECPPATTSIWRTHGR